MDYNAIAKQYGAVDSQSSGTKGAPVDYSALASKFGAVKSEVPPTTAQPTSDIKGGLTGELLTGNTQRFGKTIGESLAAPGNADLYAKTLESHTTIQNNLLKAIKAKKDLGQDTSRLQGALQQHVESTPQLKDFTGDVIDKTPGQVIGEGIGTGLEALSGGVLSSGAEAVGAKGLSTVEKINQLGKIGATYGAIGSGANTMAQGGNAGDTLTDAATGGITGYVGGAGLGLLGIGASKVAPKISQFVNPTAEDIISKREKAISDIENNYSKTRKASQFSTDAGSASRKRVAATDVLVDSVDKDGLLRTKQPGGAVEKYKEMTIGNADNVVRNGLIKEGATVSLDNVEKELTSQINNSGLEGKNLKNALNDVKKEVAGYRLKADKNGKVPLSLIHDAKVDNYRSINFQTAPEVGNARKSIARGLKNIVENNSSLNIKEVNGEIGKYLQDIKLIENLDGTRVKGGRLGKYFAQISGNIVGGAAGSAIGGPIGSAVGTIVGGELGSRIQSNILSKMLGKEAGQIAPKSEILEKAVAQNKSPRLALPAPTSEFRSQIGSGPTINLPKKTSTSIEESQLNNLGSRNISQSSTKNPTNIAIPESIPQYPKPGYQYEKYTPPENLPTIQMGSKPTSKFKAPVKGLPTIKGNTNPAVLASGALLGGATALGSSIKSALTSNPIKLYEAPPQIDNPNVIEGIDISRYATDPQHENKVRKIYDSVPTTNAPEGLDTYISEKFPDSPISGKMIYDAAEEFNISPRLITAIIQQDSGLGTRGLGKKTKNPGNVANNDSGNKFTYPSWRAGVRGVAKFLSTQRK